MTTLADLYMARLRELLPYRDASPQYLSHVARIAIRWKGEPAQWGALVRLVAAWVR